MVKDARMPTYQDALRRCVQEIEQVHARAYPRCGGGCPAEEALASAYRALILGDSYGRSYNLDGVPVKIREFLTANAELDHLSVADLRAIDALRPGDSTGFGGGADAVFILRRVS